MFRFQKYMIRESARTIVKQICGRSVSEGRSGAPGVIRLGDPLPTCELYEDYPTNVIRMPNFSSGKNIVIFAVSGAFSPGCSKIHLPGYVKAADTMKKNGVDEIICVSVNDAYVMGAWAEHQKTKTKVRMFADPTGAFIYSLGLGMNLKQFGGFRARRFSMVVVNSLVRGLQVEPDGVGLCVSLADALCYKSFMKNKSELF